jgi:Glucosamine 6-phosphate synthetase, contains amidotransferase and phosphosugar isomerase domains
MRRPRAVLPLQMLAYAVAVVRGHDVDQPRHLATSLVEESSLRTAKPPKPRSSRLSAGMNRQRALA